MKLRVTGPVFCLACLIMCSTWVQAADPPAVKRMVERSRALMAGEKPAINPGDWVSYRMQVKLPMGTVDSKIKVSSPLHVNPENPLPKNHFWLEFEMGDPHGKSDSVAVLKMLVEGDPRQAKAIKKMYLKAGRRAPFELGERWLIQNQADEESGGASCVACDKKACAAQGGKVTRGPLKNMYTRVGWLKARRVVIRMPQGDAVRVYWFCDQVPLFGFAKASLENAIELDLEGFGQGALSRIDETRAVPLPDPEHLNQTMAGSSPATDGAQDGLGGKDGAGDKKP